MSPLNKGSLMGPRGPPPSNMRPPFFGAPMPGMRPPRAPLPQLINPMMIPRQRLLPPRPGPIRGPGIPPVYGPRVHGLPPVMPPKVMGFRGPMMRGGMRHALPPQALSHMRPKFPPNHLISKHKGPNHPKKSNKQEELELKKPWMTDKIHCEIQKKNKLYVKAKKSKDPKEWEEFKDLRNKVTRLIRDAKNEYLINNPDQVSQKKDDKVIAENESV